MAASYDLRFPHNLNAEQVTQLMGALQAALVGPALSLHRPTVALSAIGNDHQLEHSLRLLDADEQRISGTIRSLLPGLRLTEADPPRATPPTYVIELRLSTGHRPLRTDRPEAVSAAVLGALGAAGTKERLELRWLLSGAHTPRPARRIRVAEPTSLPWLSPPPPSWHHEPEAARQERAKQAEPLLLAVARIAAWSPSERRARHLVASVIRALAGIHAPGVRLLVRGLPAWWVSRRFTSNSRPWIDWPLLLNASEVSSLLGWPIENPPLPGLALGAARQLPPSRRISASPSDGAVLADAAFPGVDQRIVLRDRDRLMHLHLLGPTGSGKSVLLGHVGHSDMQRGHALIAIDPRGDFVDYLADQVPEFRRDDVIFFNPADPSPVGYNPLASDGRSPHLVVDHIDHIFSRLFGGNYGPRSGDLNRAGLLTLLDAGQGSITYTLAELPLLLTNQSFRRQVVGQLQDPALIDFWRWYDALGTAQASVTAPLLNKYRALLMRGPLRLVLGQAEPNWSFDDVFRRRKILLVRLSPGEIGAEASQLLGSLLVAGIWQTAQRRTQVAAEARRPVMLIIDEFQNYLRLPTSLGDMLAQARGLGLGLTLANQQLGQLSSELTTEVLANARSRVIFQTSAHDARILARQLPGLEPEDLQGLDRYEVIAQLAEGSGVAPPASGQTRPPAAATGQARDITARSRQRYGVAAEEILQSMAERWRVDDARRQVIIGEAERPDVGGSA